MEYIIKAVKHNQKIKKQIDTTNKWEYAKFKAKKALSTNKYSKVIIERSNVIKVFKTKKTQQI